MDHDVEARLTRAGLTTDQIFAAFEEFDALDAEGQAEFKKWLDTVHDTDIQERFGDASKQQAASGEGNGNFEGGAGSSS